MSRVFGRFSKHSREAVKAILAHQDETLIAMRIEVALPQLFFRYGDTAVGDDFHLELADQSAGSAGWQVVGD